MPAYNYSVTWAWNFHEDEAIYKGNPAYAGLIGSPSPLGELAPWDPAYQNLFANDGSRFVYLSGYFSPNFGRSDRLGGLAADSWLVEILTGAISIRSARSTGRTTRTCCPQPSSAIS